MAGGDSGHIGGVERQTSLMARWFASRGYEVSMLTWDEGQEDGVVIDGVKVFNICRKDAGIKGLRFFWPKWTSLVAAMRRADADIYYQNCAECVTGQVAMWCRRHSRQFIFSVACDVDCEARLPRVVSVRSRILYRYGITTADRVIVQSQKQQKLLRTNFGRHSIILAMPCPRLSEASRVGCEKAYDGEKHILWIARITEQKRPDRLLDLAEACPDLSFDLVGPAADTEYARGVCRRATTIANVTLRGPASRDQVCQFYRNATVLCCTSDWEGFPNTFLEAWSYGVPIVSTFDPDGLIAEKGLGIVAHDIAGLADGIHRLCAYPRQREEMSRRAQQHFLENYTLDAAMTRFEGVFLDVYRRSGRNMSDI